MHRASRLALDGAEAFDDVAAAQARAMGEDFEFDAELLQGVELVGLAWLVVAALDIKIRLYAAEEFVSGGLFEDDEVVDARKLGEDFQSLGFFVDGPARALLRA